MQRGLIPAIIQDSKTGKVLTLSYMNKDALGKTLKGGKIFVFRRSKGKVMLKGEISGCTQMVKEIFVDCMDNSLLFKVEQSSGACHEGYYTCFFRRIEGDKLVTTKEKVFEPKDTYG